MGNYHDSALETAFIQLLKSNNIDKSSSKFAYKDIADWEESESMEATLDKYGDLIFFYEDEGVFEFDEDDNAVLTEKGAAYFAEN